MISLEKNIMKTKKMSIALVTFLMLSIVLIGTASAASACTTTDYPKTTQCSWQDYSSCLKLPKTVTATLTGPGTYPFTTTLSGVTSGFDVANGAYSGWCIQLTIPIHAGTPYSATLSSSFYKSSQYNMVNYILNHKGTATGQDIQAAIWLVFGYTNSQILSLAGFPVSAAAQALYNDALAHGVCFDSSSGKIVAVILCIPGFQTTIIELKNPCYCNFGCNDKCNSGCDGNKDSCNWGFNWGCDSNQHGWN